MVAFDEVEADPREYRDTCEGYEGDLVATGQVKQVPCEYGSYHVAYVLKGDIMPLIWANFFRPKRSPLKAINKGIQPP